MKKNLELLARVKRIVTHQHVKISLVFLFIVWLLLVLLIIPDSFFNPFQEVRENKNVNIPEYSFPVVPADTNLMDQSVPTTGCGSQLVFMPGRTVFIKMTSAKKQRRFLLYLPQNYTNTSEHALIIGFHGYNDTPLNLENFSKFDDLAGKNNYIVVYPEGSKALGGQRGWNTGLHPTIRSNDVLFTSNMLDVLQANLCINPNQIYATGFSNGGGFVAELACKLSNRIAAFAPVSGSYLSIFSSCNSNHAVSIVEFHGNADKTVPYLGLPSLKEVAAMSWVSGWAKRDKCSDKADQKKESRIITKYTWNNCADGASVVHYKISGGRHNWPGLFFEHAINGKTEFVGTAQTIWDFFVQHPLKQS